MHILGTNLDFIDEVEVFKNRASFSVYIASFSPEIDKINLKPWHLKLMESQSQGFVWKISWEQEKWPSIGQKGSSNIIGGAGWHEDPSPPPSASFKLSSIALSVCTGSGHKNRIPFCFFLYMQSEEFYLGKSCKMKCAANTRSQTPEIKFRKMYLFHGSPSLVHSLCDCIKVERSPFQRFGKHHHQVLHFHWFFLFKDPCRLILYCYNQWTKLEFSR